ncbi:MAG: hypothetical protein HY301_17215 [Verrucomicrobia bacterium]|nr:hypothetical protein [Verrucomicrobiota bacterium]
MKTLLLLAAAGVLLLPACASYRENYLIAYKAIQDAQAKKALEARYGQPGATALELQRQQAEAPEPRLSPREIARNEAIAAYLAGEKNRWKNAVIEHRVYVGMSAWEVELAWDEPLSVNTTRTADHVREQWVYRSRGTYIYFTDGICTAIQESR